jgi:phenylacetate-CoA ligase
LFGESYRYAKRINSTFKESKDKIDFVSSYQKEKLKSILNLACKASFYEYLNESSGEIEKLPFINKETVLKSFDKMIIGKSGADYVTTGGTSGKPLGFYINKNRKGFEWFWMTHNWAKVGFTSNDYRAVLRNHRLKGKKFKVDPLLKEYQYNNFSLDEAYLDFILNHINKEHIKFLHAYPSAAYVLASKIKKMKNTTTLHTFLCGSENVFPFQKGLIQKDLNIRMYTWYGHSEKLILAGEEQYCENYHSNPFYGYTEIIDEKGTSIKTSGLTGELVGTGFINTKMPFIRYRTGDFAEYVGEKCPDCSHIGLTFRNVKGRWNGDKIYKSDGSTITTTALNLHNNAYHYLKNIQYVQEQIGKLKVRIIPENNYTPAIREELLSELMLKVGSNLEIDIIEVEEVEYTSNKKFQLLIQKIKDTSIIPQSETINTKF